MGDFLFQLDDRRQAELAKHPARSGCDEGRQSDRCAPDPSTSRWAGSSGRESTQEYANKNIFSFLYWATRKVAICMTQLDDVTGAAAL